MRFDHVIYGTGDLDAASAKVEAELGLPVLPGGRHEGQGTHNRIVPFVSGFLELLAIRDRDEAAASTVGSLLLQRIEAGDGLLAWAVNVDDVAAVAERLGTDLYTVRRDAMEAHLTGVLQALREPCLPFFGHSNMPPTLGEVALDWIEVSGDEARIRAWLGDASDLPLRIVDGPPAVRAISVGGRAFRP